MNLFKEKSHPTMIIKKNLKFDIQIASINATTEPMIVIIPAPIQLKIVRSMEKGRRSSQWYGRGSSGFKAVHNIAADIRVPKRFRTNLPKPNISLQLFI